ncbi:MAG: bacteriohemerythrin [Rhodanobacteraceae bacterium]|nr:bacteriohemerythrin [Rhodanobacteraceae bacterium]
MSIVVWSPAFATGVKEIDDQHRRLLGYINELNAATSHADIGHILESAIDYTMYHFAFEEAVMESNGYQLLDAHKRVHDLFSRELLDLKDQYANGKMAAEQLRAALSRWLFDHISKADPGAINPSKR